MKTYLVGGAVRDSLLGLPVQDRDFVVVGASPAQMLAAGFRQVGRDFPVFLHPETSEEYALARTERKSGHGYTGFVVHAAPDVRLEDDLARRDFTLNAIARDQDSGELVDPFGGVADIRARILRHVGPAFVEDPLRVLRAARFMARFAPLGFRLAEETRTLMCRMVASGELLSLTSERVCQELLKALRSPQPSAFLRVLHETGALAVMLPEVEALYGVPQRAEYHPEVDTGVHVEMVCDMAARLAPGDDQIGFAALTHDLGKALTPPQEWPSHRQHEGRGLVPLRRLAERLKLPREHLALAEIACREHLNVHRLAQMRAVRILALLERCDAFRKPERVARLALVCEADKRGRAGFSESDYPQGALLQAVFAAARTVRAADVANGLQGEAVGRAVRRARLRAIADLQQQTAEAV